MNVQTSESETSSVKPGNMRFAFPSGARPLAGYTIKRGVGRGGFGEVFFAVSDAGKEVALKLVRRNLEVELRGVTQCLNLKHQNLVAIFDMRQDDQDNSWIIMEYVGGQSLEQVIADHPRGMPVEEALHWLRGIAAGVGYLHEHGIVHRDLKPGNIFCDEGQVKLGDYGLSKFISCSRRSGHTESIGTVHYMAPEVANGRYGREIDIYALGIILYEMLTGHVPFEGESIGEVLMKHLTAEPDLSELNEPYRSVAGRALAKDPQVRFRSVEDFLAALAGHGSAVPKAAPAGTASPGYTAHDYARGAGAAAAAAMPPPLPESDADPIITAVRDSWAKLRTWWLSDQLNTPTRVLLVILLIVVMSSQIRSLMALLVLAISGYFFYVVVREIVRYADRGTWRGNAQAVRSPQVAPHRPRADAVQPLARGAAMPVAKRAGPLPPRGGTWERAMPALVLKSRRERAADLMGSLIIAAVVTALVSLVIYGIYYPRIPVEQAVAMAIIGALGAWGVLLPAKLWEGTGGDALLRRVTMVAMGMWIGVCAYLVNNTLFVTLTYDILFGTNRGKLGFIDIGYRPQDGAPLVSAYMIYFGALFLLVRWWRQADPLRPSRLRLWPMACTVVAALLPSLLIRFPQPWGMYMGAIISLAVQLASPWDDTTSRTSG